MSGASIDLGICSRSRFQTFCVHIARTTIKSKLMPPVSL
ncbi:hypothetical protein [Escherichia phage ZH5]|uniref:Uncharacterized protein n=1 Tax=Escherichia phage ZH5 TaxID=2924930 RepID=A0AAE9GSA4_9CAUD|nr:hypothetical protein [Escherichia phage ZH5]